MNTKIIGSGLCPAVEIGYAENDDYLQATAYYAKKFITLRAKMFYVRHMKNNEKITVAVMTKQKQKPLGYTYSVNGNALSTVNKYVYLPGNFAWLPWARATM